jgi:hypothetical protein
VQGSPLPPAAQAIISLRYFHRHFLDRDYVDRPRIYNKLDSRFSNMSIETPPQTSARTVKFLGFPLLGFVLLQADGCFPVVRFSNELANFAVGTLSFLLPFVAAFFAFVIPKRWLTTVIAVVLLLPLLCFSAVGLLFDGVMARDAVRLGSDPAFERIGTVPMGGYSVAIYLSDCGAVCSPAIDLLQEKQIIPGILLTRALNGIDQADKATYQVIGQDTLTISTPAYPDSDRPWESIPARTKTYHLKPFLYF